MNLRDPLLYRIRYAPHHRTGNKWCIYPMYDYAHPLSDAIEKITHSICTLEFEAHRPLYDWCIREAEVFPSQQIEFARAQPDLHGDVEAQARSSWCKSKLVVGLGRSAHADAGGPAAARLHARGDPRLLRAHRRGQGRQHRRRRAARARPARGSQPALPARDGGAAAAQGGDRELPRGRGARARRAAAPRGSRRRARARCRSRACSTSSATTSARIRPRTGSAWRRGARCGCATPAWSSAPR